MVANGRLPPVEEGIVIFVVQACDVKRRGSFAFSLFSYYFLLFLRCFWLWFWLSLSSLVLSFPSSSDSQVGYSGLKVGYLVFSVCPKSFPSAMGGRTSFIWWA